ncbi:MAG: DUF424 domain-containing protein [Candidatus Heimdallarchaeota archaeon]
MLVVRDTPSLPINLIVYLETLSPKSVATTLDQNQTSTKLLVYLKIHRSSNTKVIAACDAELLGKTLEDRTKGIKLVVNHNFYQGELMTVKEGIEAIRVAENVNLVGSRIISAVIKENLANEQAVIVIQTEHGEIPHLQIYHL